MRTVWARHLPICFINGKMRPLAGRNDPDDFASTNRLIKAS